MDEPIGTEMVLVNPATHEAIAVDATTDLLAKALDEVRDLESRLREFKSGLSDEVLRRMDAEAKWTAHVGSYKLSAPSPAPTTEYDAKGLRDSLIALVMSDDREVPLTMAAVDAAVEVVTDLKVHKSGVNALLKLGGPVAEAVRNHEQEKPKDRRVSVSLERS